MQRREGTIDNPKCTHAAASSVSALRFRRLYITWAQTGAEAIRRSSAIHSASVSCHAG